MNKHIASLLLLALLVSACAAPPAQTEVGLTITTEPPGTPATVVTLTPVPATATVVPAATATSAPPATATAVPTASPAPTAAAFEEVLAYEMRGSFDFFWEQANTTAGSPGYGLIRDRFPGAEGIASMAAVGFGLTAIPIGIEKGYITAEAGAERVTGTLDTLLAMDRVEGFYFHFVNLSTGQRAWESEVSTIDTALLLMGVLAAGEYFGGDIAAKAQQIYAGVNWPWFVDESRSMFYMAYRPEKGFEGHWDYYAEQLVLYVLAAGSPTFPIDSTTYYGFTRHYAKYGEGRPFIHSWFGSIFTYQFSHAWLDFRGFVDREGVNWFDNSVAASQAQVDFAIANDAEYETLGPNAWGLTASDGPNGYNGRYGAPPSGSGDTAHFVDDTVAPSGAIGSILFLPEAAQQAMRHYYSLERLRSRYGFVDAYNLTKQWYATDVIGIDKGVTLLMLANFENEAVYTIVMNNEQILAGLSRLEIEPAPTAGGARP